jgi:phospholipase/carboxylesterase
LEGTESLYGPHHVPPDGRPVRQLVILLHGYGADGDDLIALAPVFAEHLPDAAFHAPHAPDACEMAPFGRQWFSLSAYDPETLRRDPRRMGPLYEAMLAGARQAAPILDDFIDELLERYGLSAGQLVLLGFSQGTMMALHVALRRQEPVAGVLGYSGALVGADVLEQEIASKPPVLLIHGDSDPVVPPQAMDAAATALEDAGVPVRTHLCPGLAHGIDQQGALLGLHFLSDRLGVPLQPR